MFVEERERERESERTELVENGEIMNSHVHSKNYLLFGTNETGANI